MVETALVISNLLFGVAILGYFYFTQTKNKQSDNTIVDKLDSFYSLTINNNQTVFKEQLLIVKEMSKSKDELFQKTLIEYLKHNERLERMILPQPVTKKAVEDILAFSPEMVPNEIEKTDKDIERDQLQELLTRIPIDKNTKVKFEDDVNTLTNGLAEEIISGSIT